MHVPDGFISPKMYIPLYGIAVALWAYGLRQVKKKLNEETIPFLAVLTALSFLLMMVAIPLPGGTSAHAMGICLLALTFGVWISFLAVSLVLLLQAVMFADGGVTSLPVNALAMGLAGSVTACFIFRWLRRVNEKAALFIAAWFSVLVPAVLVAIALGVQPMIAQTADGVPLFFPFGLRITLPAVLIPHAIMGVGEGVLTILVYRLVTRLKGNVGQ